MSQFSNFAPFGQFEFSGEPEFVSERMYNSMMSALGPAFAGSNDEAETYADAMCYGVASEQITAAGAQDDPAQCSYLIDDLLHDYMLPVVYGATLEDKRTDLAFAQASSAGSFESAVLAGLTSILGSLLINWRPMTEGYSTPCEAACWPTYPDHSPLVTTPIKKVTITSRVYPGVQTVAYTTVMNDGNDLLIGDDVVVNPGVSGLHEVVTITAVANGTFTATFTKTHEPNSPAVTGPFCTWASNARHSMIIVQLDVLTNSVLLGRVHEFMRKVMPVVSTWIICTETTTGYVGPFTVGSPVGYTPLGYSPSEPAILITVP